MSDIYSRAACTIAATTAENSDGGLFFERDPTLLQPRRIEATRTLNLDAVELEKDAYLPAGLYWCDNRELWNEAIERAPLNLRAWVCQERHLSSRMIHFSDTQLFWECHEGTACENYPSGLPEWAVPYWSENTSVLRQDLYQLRLQKADISLDGLGIRGDISTSDAGPPPDYELYFSWAVFRIHYTTCAMTKEEDKLVAIRGIEQQFGHALGDQLAAGLWYNRLLEELCWFKLIYTNEPPPRKPTKWRAPTWSWASSNARIWASNTTKFHRRCQNKQIWGELDNVDVKTNASGELEHASLRIRCKPIRATIEPYPNSDGTAYYTLYGILTLQNSMVEIQVERSGDSEFDIEMDDFGWEEIRHVHMIIIQRCPHHPGVNKKADDEDLADCVEGLLLVPQQECDDIFERVGLFTAKGSPTVVKMLEDHDATESRVITLI
jgi:hypothetical protein